MGKLNGKVIWVAVKTTVQASGLMQFIHSEEPTKTEVFSATSKAAIAEALGVGVHEIHHGAYLNSWDVRWYAVVYKTELIAKQRGKGL